MKRYSVIVTATTVHAGRVQLTKEQAKSRLHNLKDCGKDVYEVLKPVQFKRGEEFGYDGEYPKGLANQVVSPEEAKAAAAAETKAKKKAESEAAAKKKRDDDAAADKAQAMDIAIEAADKIVQSVRSKLLELGNKADPDLRMTIEDTIGDMEALAEAGDIDGFTAATGRLDGHAKSLNQKP